MPSEELKFVDFSKIFPIAERGPKPIQMPNSGVKHRILIGDADPVYTLVLFESLVQAGYEAVVAATGTDAIAELRKADHPPVAILDCEMPGMDASEICQRMRDAGKDVYLILSSEKPTTQEIVSGLESGADLYLPKSILPQELLAHVKVGLRTVGRQRASAEKLQLTGGEWLTPQN